MAGDWLTWTPTGKLSDPRLATSITIGGFDRIRIIGGKVMLQTAVRVECDYLHWADDDNLSVEDWIFAGSDFQSLIEEAQHGR